MDPQEKQELRQAGKNASQIGLLLGAISLVLGSLACLYYLLRYEPWKFR